MKLTNPEYVPHRGLGESDAQWVVFKEQITAYMRDHAGDSTVEEADVRRLDPKFADQKIWDQLLADLGIMEIPDRG